MRFKGGQGVLLRSTVGQRTSNLRTKRLVIKSVVMCCKVRFYFLCMAPWILSLVDGRSAVESWEACFDERIFEGTIECPQPAGCIA